MTNDEYAGATAVTLYGVKPPLMYRWLGQLQVEISRQFPQFVPRTLEQIHATVIGLEFPLRPVAAEDVRGLMRSIAEAFENPVDMRLGGYYPGASSFTSRGVDPYERSFALSGGLATLIGWPVPPSNILGRIRKRAEQFGFRHRYHDDGPSLDSDWYLVVGDFPNGHDNPRAAESRIRDYLAARPLDVRVTASDLALVRYQKTTLDLATSEKIADLSPDIAAQVAAISQPA
ncbi:hypothetical protein [Paractinoplanes lichenicola]|uniref:Uncharacterized protein n=1 Tax=Paractinoplanes lichenicola TaxID=2802976 RepID=A0ABS1W1P3_9ACTN|nr:hypothetical protein [Actinoplanes lichenicola]MBL7260660.1 hypothetical protein [Actinoplanes lichenicola]